MRVGDAQVIGHLGARADRHGARAEAGSAAASRAAGRNLNRAARDRRAAGVAVGSRDPDRSAAQLRQAAGAAHGAGVVAGRRLVERDGGVVRDQPLQARGRAHELAGRDDRATRVGAGARESLRPNAALGEADGSRAVVDHAAEGGAVAAPNDKAVVAAHDRGDGARSGEGSDRLRAAAGRKIQRTVHRHRARVGNDFIGAATDIQLKGRAAVDSHGAGEVVGSALERHSALSNGDTSGAGDLAEEGGATVGAWGCVAKQLDVPVERQRPIPEVETCVAGVGPADADKPGSKVGHGDGIGDGRVPGAVRHQSDAAGAGVAVAQHDGTASEGGGCASHERPLADQRAAGVAVAGCEGEQTALDADRAARDRAAKGERAGASLREVLSEIAGSRIPGERRARLAHVDPGPCDPRVVD